MNGIGETTFQRGISLIEVLVALLVLGIGVMGFAALQLNAVRVTEDTYSRSQAMAVAQDLIERVRSNLEAKTTYVVAGSWSADVVQPKSCLATNPASIEKLCSPAEMAADDIYQVRSTVETMLPSGAMKVAECSAATCVTVAWGPTTPASCDQVNVNATTGDRGADASCVVVEFIP